MDKLGIKFITAISRHEYTNYAGNLAKQCLEFNIDELSERNISNRAKELIEQSDSFTKTAEDFYTIDLGVIEITSFEISFLIKLKRVF